MKYLTYIIKEMKLDDNEDLGGKAVSFVSHPAINTPFIHLGENLLPFFKYTADPEPELLDDGSSHQFCKENAGKVFHVSEINNWGRFSNNEKTSLKFIEESNFFESFDGNGNSNIDQQLYNCRHWFKRISKIEDIPSNKRHLLQKETIVQLKVNNEEKRIVKGLLLRSGQFIYRNDADGHGNPGFIYFSKNTIKELFKRFGYNRTITFQHRQDITGTCVLLNSWIEENDKEVDWFVEYKVISDKLWNIIKSKGVIGFSIEAIMTF
jgi:hypothetical protein